MVGMASGRYGSCGISCDWTHLISSQWDHRPEPLFDPERRVVARHCIGHGIDVGIWRQRHALRVRLATGEVGILAAGEDSTVAAGARIGVVLDVSVATFLALPDANRLRQTKFRQTTIGTR
jgi:hypothetical protein